MHLLVEAVVVGVSAEDASFRDDRTAEVEQRVDAITADLGVSRQDMAKTALRFVLSAPAVSKVIPGMRSVRNAEWNCVVSDGRVLTSDRLTVLTKHRWNRNFYS